LPLVRRLSLVVCLSASLGMSEFVPPPAIEADLVAARGVLREFGFDPSTAQIECPEAACGFSGALILRVQHDGAWWCLRRWPRRGLPARRIAGLHHFAGWLRQAGVQEIAVPVVSPRGESLVDHQGHLWQIEPWMPGRADFLEDPADEKLQSALQALARLHRAAERYEPPANSREWFDQDRAAPSPACGERLQILADWSPSRCESALRELMRDDDDSFRRLGLEILRGFETLRDPIRRQLQSRSVVAHRLHPCLRDVWHDHLLFTGGRLSGLIDLSATRTENVAADLSRLLGSLLGDDRLRWEFALDCYHDVRPLTGAERELIRVLDRSSVLLSGLTWISRRMQGELPDQQLPRVVERLEVLCRRLDVLASSYS